MTTYLTFLKDPDPLNEFDHTSVTVESRADSLPEILEAFEGFLKAAGFVFTGASLRLVDDDTEEPRRFRSATEEADWVAQVLRGLATESDPTPPAPEGEVGPS